MALLKTIQLIDNYGETIVFPNAYIKVVSVSARKDFAAATYKFYKTQNEPELEERTIRFTYDLEGPNSIKQAYQFLKTLPEFSDAVDC
jgi:hypothetical protein